MGVRDMIGAFEKKDNKKAKPLPPSSKRSAPAQPPTSSSSENPHHHHGTRQSSDAPSVWSSMHKQQQPQHQDNFYLDMVDSVNIDGRGHILEVEQKPNTHSLNSYLKDPALDGTQKTSATSVSTSRTPGLSVEVFTSPTTEASASASAAKHQQPQKTKTTQLKKKNLLSSPSSSRGSDNSSSVDIFTAPEPAPSPAKQPQKQKKKTHLNSVLDKINKKKNLRSSSSTTSSTSNGSKNSRKQGNLEMLELISTPAGNSSSRSIMSVKSAGNLRSVLEQKSVEELRSEALARRRAKSVGGLTPRNNKRKKRDGSSNFIMVGHSSMSSFPEMAPMSPLSMRSPGSFYALANEAKEFELELEDDNNDPITAFHRSVPNKLSYDPFDDDPDADDPHAESPAKGRGKLGGSASNRNKNWWDADSPPGDRKDVVNTKATSSAVPVIGDAAQATPHTHQQAPVAAASPSIRALSSNISRTQQQTLEQQQQKDNLHPQDLHHNHHPQKLFEKDLQPRSNSSDGNNFLKPSTKVEPRRGSLEHKLSQHSKDRLPADPTVAAASTKCMAASISHNVSKPDPPATPNRRRASLNFSSDRSVRSSHGAGVINDDDDDDSQVSIPLPRPPPLTAKSPKKTKTPKSGGKSGSGKGTKQIQRIKVTTNKDGSLLLAAQGGGVLSDQKNVDPEKVQAAVMRYKQLQAAQAASKENGADPAAATGGTMVRKKVVRRVASDKMPVEASQRSRGRSIGPSAGDSRGARSKSTKRDKSRPRQDSDDKSVKSRSRSKSRSRPSRSRLRTEDADNIRDNDDDNKSRGHGLSRLKSSRDNTGGQQKEERGRGRSVCAKRRPSERGPSTAHGEDGDKGDNDGALPVIKSVMARCKSLGRAPNAERRRSMESTNKDSGNAVVPAPPTKAAFGARSKSVGRPSKRDGHGSPERTRGKSIGRRMSCDDGHGSPVRTRGKSIGRRMSCDAGNGSPVRARGMSIGRRMSCDAGHGSPVRTRGMSIGRRMSCHVMGATDPSTLSSPSRRVGDFFQKVKNGLRTPKTNVDGLKIRHEMMDEDDDAGFPSERQNRNDVLLHNPKNPPVRKRHSQPETMPKRGACGDVSTCVLSESEIPMSIEFLPDDASASTRAQAPSSVLKQESLSPLGCGSFGRGELFPPSPSPEPKRGVQRTISEVSDDRMFSKIKSAGVTEDMLEKLVASGLVITEGT